MFVVKIAIWLEMILSKENPVSCIFLSRKKLTTEKNHICGTFWTDGAVLENLTLFFWPNASILNNTQAHSQTEAMKPRLQHKFGNLILFSP